MFCLRSINASDCTVICFQHFNVHTKALTYDEQLKMKRDATEKKTAFCWVSLLIFCRWSKVTVLMILQFRKRYEKKILLQEEEINLKTP